MALKSYKATISTLIVEIAPCVRKARGDFNVIDSVNAAYTKHQCEDMCVLYNCFLLYCLRERNFMQAELLPNENRGVFNEGMAQSLSCN